MVVGVLENPGKTPLFTAAERVEMIRDTGPSIELIDDRLLRQMWVVVTGISFQVTAELERRHRAEGCGGEASPRGLS